MKGRNHAIQTQDNLLNNGTMNLGKYKVWRYEEITEGSHKLQTLKDLLGIK